MTSLAPLSAFSGFRSPREVIAVAVRWYLQYGLSYRDVEELLAERGIQIDHVTVYRYVQRFTTEFIEAARPCRRLPGGRWFVDKTYVKVSGWWTYAYRAGDQHDHGQAQSVATPHPRVATLPVSSDPGSRTCLYLGCRGLLRTPLA